VYIGFSSLSAYDFCGQVGASYANTTVAFDPDELWTVSYALVAGTPVTMVSGDLTTLVTYVTTPTFYTSSSSARLNYQDLEKNCSSISGYTYLPGNPSNANAGTREFSRQHCGCAVALTSI
jgi:hypothetical protein